MSAKTKGPDARARTWAGKITTNRQQDSTLRPRRPGTSTGDSITTLAALSYAERGFRVLPVHAVKGRRKHPKLKRWQKKATRDEKTIRKWFNRHPDDNIGIMPPEGH